MVQDPVCGMKIDEKSAGGKVEYEGQTYYFCSLYCLRAFNNEPQKYILGKDAHPTHQAHTKSGR